MVDGMTISAPTEKGKTMTAIEYMEKQVDKHCRNYVREFTRGVPYEVLENIMAKIIYYVSACEALRDKEGRT